MTENEWFNALYELLNNAPEGIMTETYAYPEYDGEVWGIEVFPEYVAENEQLTLF